MKKIITATNKTQENCDIEAKGCMCFEKETVNNVECAERTNKMRPYIAQ